MEIGEFFCGRITVPGLMYFLLSFYILAENTMNILQVNCFDNIGGAARIAWDLHRGYRSRGENSDMAVEVKTSQDPAVRIIPRSESSGFPDRFLYSIGLWMEQQVKHYGLMIGGKNIGRFLKKTSEYRHWWTIFQGREDFDFPGSWNLLQTSAVLPDVVHLHNLHSNYFDLRFLPKLSTSYPAIITLHDMWLLTGHCAHSFDCARWETGCGACPYLDTPPAVRKDATSYNWNRKKEIYEKSKLYLAFPSKWIMDKAKESILAPAIMDSRVIHNGVDLSLFCPGDKLSARIALNLDPESLVILFVAIGSSNNLFKDFSTMRNALELVSGQLSGRKVTLIALGGDDSLSNIQIGNMEILFAPYVSDMKKVAQYYQASDLYLHAARGDTFPNVVLEALACGTPVIATGVGGIPEQIKDGETGFVVPPRDSYTMAMKILNLLEDSQARKRFSFTAVEDVKRRFGLDQMIDGYLKYYQDAIQDWQEQAVKNDE